MLNNNKNKILKMSNREQLELQFSKSVTVFELDKTRNLGYHINLLVVNIEAFFPGQVVGFSKRFHFYGKEQSGVHFTAQWLFGVKRCLLRVLNPQDYSRKP